MFAFRAPDVMEVPDRGHVAMVWHPRMRRIGVVHFITADFYAFPPGEEHLWQLGFDEDLGRGVVTSCCRRVSRPLELPRAPPTSRARGLRWCPALSAVPR
eukprot:6654952-Pyramimonas_sp.AAC.1